MKKTQSFFKGVRSKIAIEISKKPAVLIILYRLAMFTPRTGDEEKKWVLIKWGDIGLSRQQFRDAKDYIVRNHLGTIRRTIWGTMFKLIGNSVFDINEEDGNHMKNHRGTISSIQEGNKKIKQEDIYSDLEKNSDQNLPEKKPEDLPSSVKVSALHEKVLHLGEDYGVKLVTKGIRFEKIEAAYQHDHVLAVAEALFLWAVDSKNLKEVSTARLKKFLIQDLKYRAEKQQNKWAGVSDKARVFNTKTNYTDNGLQKSQSATFPNDKNFLEMQRQSAIAERFFKWKVSGETQLPKDLEEQFKTLTDASFIESCKKCVAKKLGIQVTEVKI